ncbi:MAG TPA: hypothetical protein VNO30_27075 [Kofleriaceae bacterium]|nr:hypothetical protein [Kofleriaceae bacterium]
MSSKRLWCGAITVATLAACGTGSEEDASDTATVDVSLTGTVPTDGRCTHITSTRLSDFTVSSYQGLLAGASFTVNVGEAHVTATAYPEPCSAEPTEPPWIADEQITTFNSGANVLVLSFHSSASVTIEPSFELPGEVAVRPATGARLSRNGEDAAGPGFALDGWNVTALTLPPAAPTETFLFSVRGQGGITTTPRGLARLPSGIFVVQQPEIDQPLRTFSAAGAFLASWPVVYPADKIRWDATDGLEAIDGSHLVRTGYLNAPIGCDVNGANCIQAGIEILDLTVDGGGMPVLVVSQQIRLPEPYNLAYPVGVAKVGANFAVATLPNVTTELILVAPDGTLVAGPVSDLASLEGLFVTADGRLGALDYHGGLRMYNAADASPRPGETATFSDGLGFGIPRSLAWDSAAGRFLALSADRRVVGATQDFTAITNLPINLSSYLDPRGMDYRPDGNQVAIADRIPPVNATTGTRIPRIDFYDLATSTLASSVLLDGTPVNPRVFSIAYVPARQQILSNYRRIGNPPDLIDSMVYTHRLDGSLAGAFDLRPRGIKRVYTVNYLPATDEILCTGIDLSNQVRLVVTSPTGQPRRSYRADPIAGVSELAPITSGTYQGDLGVIFAEPSEYLRAKLE